MEKLLEEIEELFKKHDIKTGVAILIPPGNGHPFLYYVGERYETAKLLETTTKKIDRSYKQRRKE